MEWSGSTLNMMQMSPQGLAQRVLQLGRDARANAEAGLAQRGQRQQQQQSSMAGPDGRQPQRAGIPAAVLGIAAATLLLGPSAPLFLFTFLPILAAGSGGPRFAPAGISYSQQPGMGFQVFQSNLLSVYFSLLTNPFLPQSTWLLGSLTRTEICFGAIAQALPSESPSLYGLCLTIMVLFF